MWVLPFGENILHDMGKKVKLPFFTHKAFSTDVVGFFDGPVVVVVAQKDDRHVVVETLHELDEVEAADGRHGDIDDHEIVGAFAQKLHGFAAVLGDIHLVPVLGKHFTRDPQSDDLVVYQ